MSPYSQQPVRWRELSELAAGRFSGTEIFQPLASKNFQATEDNQPTSYGVGVEGGWGASGFQQRVAGPPSQACPLQKERLLQSDGEKGPCTWQGGLRKLSRQAVAGE